MTVLGQLLMRFAQINCNQNSFEPDVYKLADKVADQFEPFKCSGSANSLFFQR